MSSGSEHFVIDYDISLNNLDKMLELQNAIIESSAVTYVINFTSSTNIFHSAAATILGAMIIYCKSIGKNIIIEFEMKNDSNNVDEFLKTIGLYEYFAIDRTEDGVDDAHVIPFGKIDDEDIMEEYTDRIMRLAPIQISKNASDVLSSYFYEVYQNSFTHAESEIGVFSCGHWTEAQLAISIYDMGVGIPYRVREKISSHMTSAECVEWAFKEGTTTKDEMEVKRGLGLSNLEKFIKLNNGILSLYSEDVCYSVINGKNNVRTLAHPIKGTLINISIAADKEHDYILSSEKENGYERDNR